MRGGPGVAATAIMFGSSFQAGSSSNEPYRLYFNASSSHSSARYWGAYLMLNTGYPTVHALIERSFFLSTAFKELACSQPNPVALGCSPLSQCRLRRGEEEGKQSHGQEMGRQDRIDLQ